VSIVDPLEKLTIAIEVGSIALNEELVERMRAVLAGTGAVRGIVLSRSAQIRFAEDSALEGNGFELPVPRTIRLRFRDFALARLR
jgi:hypothetical protein